ncbi:hypothetical protein BCR33DRAFT_806773 [Rhizoclosmatium globosum]|uniref:DDE-1 domain-containing protein n=1 Tax=Rhizoclosmatium globosum TaxID=329046 RepID=A0A1Y2ARX5_9FUNG|nr:hypothetical protein BCR33DRAFT_806773 [Rhizoclosmatium globosum]|eukprot:ORY25282.1 hypothetical protein BCR33DRAFT_806773 [Rhizoclosmatium globosum]
MTNLINNGFSVNSAAEEVSTNLSTTKETIRGIYYRMIEHPNRTHGNSVFSDEEENALTALLEARSLCRQPMSRMAFIDFATTVFHEINGPSEWTAEKWYDGFISRHSDRLCRRATKAISKARISPVTYESVCLWVEAYGKYMKDKGYKFQNVMNVDEMRIKLQNDNSQSTVLESTLVARPGEVKGDRSKHASFLSFVVATGEQVMDVLILPLEFGNLQLEDPDAQYGFNNKTPVILLFSDTGFLTETQWIPILTELAQRWKILHPRIKPFLLLDNLGTHKTFDVLHHCYNCGIDGFPFPANTTHFLQPLDDVLFANLKNTIVRLYRAKKSFSLDLLGSLGKELVPVALEARNCLTPALIQSAFCRTGIYPFDKEKIWEKAKLNVAAPLDETDPQNAAINLLVRLFRSSATSGPVGMAAVKPKKFLKLDQPYSLNQLFTAQQKELEEKEAAAAEKVTAKALKLEAQEAKKRAKAEEKDGKQCQAIPTTPVVHPCGSPAATGSPVCDVETTESVLDVRKTVRNSLMTM